MTTECITDQNPFITFWPDQEIAYNLYRDLLISDYNSLFSTVATSADAGISYMQEQTLECRHHLTVAELAFITEELPLLIEKISSESSDSEPEDIQSKWHSSYNNTDTWK